MTRKLESWIEGFKEYSSNSGSPALYITWGAITCIAGALERRVWVVTRGEKIHPNFYTIMVGPPGVGKTFITNRVGTFWRQIPGHHVARSSITSAGLADELRHAERHVIRPGIPPESFNSLKICSNELQVLVPQYDFDLMGKLTEIYDGHPYGETRRTRENTFDVPRPQINLLAACTPKYLTSVMPEGAWDLGFMSRCLMIFGEAQQRSSLFNKKSGNKNLFDNLVEDIKEIGSDALYGEMTFSDEAAELMDAWYIEGCPPEPDHPKLVNYNTRRPVHMLKLLMVLAADAGRMEIQASDFDKGLALLTEAEISMPEIFKSMEASADGKIVEDVFYIINKTYLVNGKTPLPKKFIYSLLVKKLPSYAVKQTLDNMESSGMLRTITVEKYGTCYIPQEPH